MSLFIRMAQTRLGAERLLDAQILPILSQCDYIEARPEADQSFIGKEDSGRLNDHLAHIVQIMTPSCLLLSNDITSFLCQSCRS